MKMSSGHYFLASRHVFGLLEPCFWPRFGHSFGHVFRGQVVLSRVILCVYYISCVQNSWSFILLISLKSLLSASEYDLFIAVPPWYYIVPPRYFIVPLFIFLYKHSGL
jgi:hypothetical protein